METCADDSVDGDFNGNPQLEGLDQTEHWEGVDALEGMAGREEEVVRASGAPEAVLADAVAERRSLLEERLDEARELGLGAVFESALAATATGTGPLIADDEVLRDRLAAIDAALEELERKSAP